MDPTQHLPDKEIMLAEKVAAVSSIASEFKS